jgi:hypothetical protein
MLKKFPSIPSSLRERKTERECVHVCFNCQVFNFVCIGGDNDVFPHPVSVWHMALFTA